MGEISAIRSCVFYDECSSKNKEEFASTHPFGRCIVWAVEGALSRNPKENACWLNEKIYYRVFEPETEPFVRIEVVYDISKFSKVIVRGFKWNDV